MRSIREDIDRTLELAIDELEGSETATEVNHGELAGDLRQTREDFNRLRTWIELAEQIANLGAWEHDLKNDKLYWSDETYRILGYEPGEVEPSYKHFMRRVHPEDKERIAQAFFKSLEEQESYHVIYRLQLPEEELKIVEAQAAHFYDDAGEPVITIGINQEVTDKELEKHQIEKSLAENRTLLGGDPSPGEKQPGGRGGHASASVAPGR